MASIKDSYGFDQHCVPCAIWGGHVCVLSRCQSAAECTTWLRRRGSVYQSNSFAGSYLNTVGSIDCSGMGSRRQLNSADYSYELTISTSPADSDYATIQPSSAAHYSSSEYCVGPAVCPAKASHSIA